METLADARSHGALRDNRDRDAHYRPRPKRSLPGGVVEPFPDGDQFQSSSRRKPGPTDPRPRQLKSGSRLSLGRRFGELGGALADAADHLLQGRDADAVAEIAEPLAGGPRSGPQREQGIERVGDAGDVEPLGDRLVEPGSLKV